MAVTTGGLSRHATLRMHAVDQVVEAAVAEGVTQVVVVGAGFDTRAWRLDSLRACNVWELDLPATQHVKKSELGADTDVDNVHFVEADLSVTTIPEALAETDHDAELATAWIWEGVAPYLTRQAVSGTLEGIVASSAVGSRLAMTFANPNLMGPQSFAPVAGMLAQYGFWALGEPILSTYDEWEICEVLRAAGFTDIGVSDADAWAREAGFSARPDPLRAEMLVTARVVRSEGSD